MEASVGVVGVLHGIVGAEREAGIAAEAVACAVDLHAVLRLHGKRKRLWVISIGVCRDSGNHCGSHAPEAVVLEGYVGGGVVIDDVGEGTGVVVGIGGRNPARPGAGGELAVGGVGVGGALAVCVEFVGMQAGGGIVEPGGEIKGHRGREGRKGRAGGQLRGEDGEVGGIVAGGGHGGHAAKGIVLVGDGIGRAPGGDGVVVRIVGGVGDLAEGVGDGGAASEGVVGVPGAVGGGIGLPGDAAEVIVAAVDQLQHRVFV